MDNEGILKQYLEKYQLHTLLPFIKEIFLRQYSPGEYLCHAGEVIESFSIIVEGKCKVIPYSEDGKVILLDYLEPVSFNGDIELLNDCEALYNVRAIQPTTVIVIPRDVFFRIVMEDRVFLKMMCEKFAKKLYSSSTNYSQKMLYSVKQRLCKYLVEQIVKQETSSIRFKGKEVSQKLGISERHLRRVLNEMEVSGFFVRKHGILECNQAMLQQGY
ncbi:MAG: Crp/Fnr family transcriptional regulator [Coprobacillaceae bacterium]